MVELQSISGAKGDVRFALMMCEGVWLTPANLNHLNGWMCRKRQGCFRLPETPTVMRGQQNLGGPGSQKETVREVGVAQECWGENFSAWGTER